VVYTQFYFSCVCGFKESEVLKIQANKSVWQIHNSTTYRTYPLHTKQQSHVRICSSHIR